MAGRQTLDERWYLTLTELRADTGWLHPAAAVFSWWAGLAVLVVLLAVAAVRTRERQAGPAVATVLVAAAVSVAAVTINSVLLAPAIGRDRPCERWTQWSALLECSTHSMPSDHSLVAGILAAGLWGLNHRFGLLAAALAGAIAFSRVYVGLHYPSDVIIGLVLGAGLGWYAVRMARQPVASWLARQHLLARTRRPRADGPR
ncbi:phosphatase PAP2 family protein [Citricoccus sp. NPDC079358]|uniref:phosphatase PAP2 family protein n=1 Tax=Citricoccus sp. NPDC079358 TaxID=3154653 RepID=UPI0034501EAC